VAAESLAVRARRADDLVAAGRGLLRDVIVEAAAEGMSQREIARLVGRSQPEVARYLQAARRTFATVPQIVEAMREPLAQGDEHRALRLLLDGVNVLPGLGAPRDVRAFLKRPRSLGDSRWDALVAAAVAYRARTAGLVPPRWTDVKPLTAFWWPAGEHALRARTMARTPIDFKRLGIWFDERNFTTA
jgi:transcriptional regulator with XRE-family HTH domain